MSMLTKEEAWAQATFAIDTALTQRRVAEIPDDGVRYVIFERPDGTIRQIVAVWSYLPNTSVDDSEAEALADGLLRELGVFDWRADGVPEPTYIL